MPNRLLNGTSFLRPPNGAADKLRAAKAQAKRSAEASVSFIRWMGGRERRERKPDQRIYPPRR